MNPGESTVSGCVPGIRNHSGSGVGHSARRSDSDRPTCPARKHCRWEAGSTAQRRTRGDFSVVCPRGRVKGGGTEPRFHNVERNDAGVSWRQRVSLHPGAERVSWVPPSPGDHPVRRSASPQAHHRMSSTPRARLFYLNRCGVSRSLACTPEQGTLLKRPVEIWKKGH
jgi:hypothetical protein